jgi:hypothetical protein
VTPADAGPRVGYVGAINQDGCPFCCEFLCRLTPTPTPIIDSLGREVLLRTTGTFLLAIEGRRGSSNIDPGGNNLPVDDDRGDLQILINHSTGEPNSAGFGSTEICDKGPPPTPFGGVPGIDPPDLSNMSPAVTAAIQDMACRFTVIENDPTKACTRVQNGDFGFLGTSTRKQYCYQVPLSGEFQAGDNAVTIQLRDLAGNLGPKKEVVIRVLP